MNKSLVLKIIKVILMMITIGILIYLTIKFIPLFKKLATVEGQEAFKSKVEELGIFGPLLVVGLVILQVLVAFLPGEPVEILAGMCLGTFGGLIATLIGASISSSIVFFFVRKFGIDFISIFFGKENIVKFQNSKLLKDKKKIEVFMAIMFFIPGTPKDLFTYLAGLLDIKMIRFVLISTIARIPSVITSTIVGANLVNGNIAISIITFVITLFISIIGVLIGRKIHKKI